MKRDNNFSYFKAPIKNTSPYKDISLGSVYEAIKNNFRDATNKLRSFDDVDAKREFKSSQLDYVTFSGTFTKRGTQYLKEYSGLIALDFDHVDINEVKTKLLNQQKVDTALLFVSPSGDGVKWIVPSTTAEDHLQVFKMYKRFCKDKFNLEVDEACKDVSRACFIPHDPNVICSTDFQFRKLEEYWSDPQPTKEPQNFTHAPESNYGHSKELSPFDDYNLKGDTISLLQGKGWQTVGDTAGKVMLSRPGKNDKGISADYRKADRLLHVFTSSTQFKANQSYNPSQVFAILECNNDMKLARQKLISLGYGEATANFSAKDETLQADLKREDFNFYSDDFKITASRLARFYDKEGFIKIDVDEDMNPIIIKNENKILKPYNYRNKIISYLKNNIRHEDKRTELETILVKKKYDIYDSFLLLDEVPYSLNKDTKDIIYLPFKNGVAKATADGMELIPYESDELDLFMEVESINHEFNRFDYGTRKMGQFEKFLLYAITGREATAEDLTTKETKDVGAFFSMIGYLISNYKNKAGAFAIILSDAGANDEDRNGGRGKTIITDAVKQVRKEKFRGGNEHDSGYRHNFADLEPYHDLFILDDVPKTFKYDDLYSQITGDITSQKKQKHAVTIPFADAPKFVITTNWAVPYHKEATSTNRRFIEYKLTDFWNLDNQPADYFGNRLFDDWDSDEWTLFFQFMCICSSHFLSVGIQKIDYSKEADNFRAYFSNDVILETFERIWKELEHRDSFTVMDFLSEYQKLQLYESKPMFHRNNVKMFIDIYIEYNDLPFKYSVRRKWNSINENDKNDTDDKSNLPF